MSERSARGSTETAAARRYIQIRTGIPGPRSRELIERAGRVVARGISVLAPVVVEKAQGALLTDVDGNTYIDLSGGIGVVNVGHCPGPVVDAVRHQAGRFLHTDYSVVPYEPYITLAEELVRLTPGVWPKKACLFNSGAEAVENAVKIARASSRRRAVIAYEGAFHGRTLMALSLTSKPRPYKEGLGPFAPEVYRVPYAYCYRCPLGLKYPACGVRCADALDRAFSTMVSPADTAAVIVEPVQGEGGFVVPPPEFLPRVQDICRKHNVLLIVDEIQTGFCRTGRVFACEHTGVEPDLICVAKSLAAGMPLSGVVGRTEVMDAPVEGGIGGTYVGNPLACAAALEVIKLIRDQGLPARAEAIGRRIMDRALAMQEKYRIIGEVRGLGAMVGIELVRDRKTKEPAAEETSRIIGDALRQGVIIPRCGIYNNVLRFLNPLTITDDQLDEALDVLEGCIATADQGLSNR